MTVEELAKRVAEMERLQREDHDILIVLTKKLQNGWCGKIENTLCRIEEKLEREKEYRVRMVTQMDSVLGSPGRNLTIVRIVAGLLGIFATVSGGVFFALQLAGVL